MFNSAKHRIGVGGRRALRLLFGLAWFGVCAVCVEAGAAQRIVIGAVPGLAPPLDVATSPSVTDRASGIEPLRGISADFARAVMDALGAEPQWRLYPDRASMIAALARGDIDMGTGATGEDSGASLALSRAYLSTKQVVVEPLTKRVPTHRLAYVDTQTSLARLKAAYPTTTPAAYRDTVAALLAVALGEADRFVGDVTAASYAIGHLDLPGLAITGFAPFEEDGYSFVFAADRPAAQALRERVDAALASLPPRFQMVSRARWEVAATAVSLERPLDLTAEEKAWIAAHPVVRYSMLSRAPPIMFRDAQGNAAGFVPDIIDAIARITGIRFEARLRNSVADIRRDLQDGASALMPYGMARDPNDARLLSTMRFGEGLVAIVTRAGDPPLRDAAALASKRVALPDEFPAQQLVRERMKGARIVRVAPIDGQLRAVASGAADATLLDMAFATYAVGNPYRGKLEISGVLSDTPAPHVLLVARDQTVLLGILNRAIAALPPYELEMIRARWKLDQHPETLWERRRPQVALGAVLGGALLLVLAAWALTLRVQIVRRIAAEHAMRAAKEDAETANRAKSTFLATMSHEIRTPMNAVLGLIEMELRAPGERAATERALSTAHRAARDLLGMIDDLLDVAKIEAERLVLAPAPLELDAWIAGVAAIYEPAARAKGVALVVKRQGESGPTWLLADGQRLRQVVGNLLSNAIKFTDIGAVTLDYAAATPRDGLRAVTLAVSDTGIGIAPERQAALFTPFVQAHDGGARSVGGTGLGLTISKRLVTMMGGVIELSSEPGRGTRFTVRLDFPEAEAVASPAEVSAVATGASGDPLAGLRVLVVDDHPANRIVLDGQIRLLGGAVELAVDGKSALARWRAAPRAFDVILTDCSMPEMSGEELARAIREGEANDASKPRPVPIIGLTANAQPDAAARAVAAGMTACRVKPIGLDDLRDALLAAAGARRAPAASPVPRPAAPASAFDRALLASFGEQAGTLADTLKSANAQDLADAHAAFDDCDWSRLRDTAHRMKGGSAIIGAAPFMRACVALQDDCDRALDEDRNGEDDPRIAASFAAFVASAGALDTALGRRAA